MDVQRVGKLGMGDDGQKSSPLRRRCECLARRWICQCGASKVAREDSESPRLMTTTKAPVWRRLISAMTALSLFKAVKTDKRPRVDTKVNEHKVRGLIDSGADITCLQWQEFLRMKDRPQLRPYQSRLSTASGDPLQVMGVAPMKYQFGKMSITWDTVVVRNLKSPLILGIDFMEAHGMVLDAGKREVTLRGGKAIKLLRTPGMGVSKKEYKVGQYEARQVTIITGEAPGGKYVADGPWVDAGIIETDKKGEANILFYNRTCEPVTLRRDSPICSVEPLDLTLSEVESVPLEPGDQGYRLPWTHLPPPNEGPSVKDDVNSKYAFEVFISL